MSIALCLRMMGLLLALAGFCTAARAEVRLQLDASTPLIVLKVQGTGAANVRALPDPRSATLLQLPAGTSNLRASGVVKLYGDTWWIEIQTGAVTGWLNARLVGKLSDAVPLQAFVNIDDLPRVNDYAFQGRGFQELPVTSFDQCARLCVGDGKCVAIEYNGASGACRLLDNRTEVRRQTGIEIAAKPVKVPAGGWAAQSAARFDRVADKGADVDGYRVIVSGSIDECANACGIDQRCGAFGYQRKALLCTAYERIEKIIARNGVDTGVRQIVRAPATVADLISSAGAVQTAAPVVAQPRAMPSKERIAEAQTVAEMFKALFASASESGSYATAEITRHGRVAFVLEDRALGGAMHAAVMPRVLEGSVHNLAAIIGRTDRRIVHLAYYAGPAAPPVILASSTYAVAEAAVTAAFKLQSDLDALVKITGLGVDPLSLLKPLRR